MTFEGQYLTYQEYLDLGGSQIEELPFNLLEYEARRKIDIRTFNRLKRTNEIPQEVKLCEYNMINSINNFNNSLKNTTDNNGKKSENTDGYSVSYLSSNEISEVIKSKNDDLNDIIDTYLREVKVDNVFILYRGVE